MNKPTLYIFCGLPYSGKTTLAKELVNRFGFNVVSIDKVINQKSYNPVTMTQEQWNEVYTEGYQQLEQYLKDGESTILDLGNLKRRERDNARAISEAAGANHKLIYFNTPSDEIKRRGIGTKERGQLEDVVMERAFNMWEEPTPDENPILFNVGTNLEEWIAKNISEELVISKP